MTKYQEDKNSRRESHCETTDANYRANDYDLPFSNHSFMASWTAFLKAPFFPPNLLTTSSLKLCSKSSSILTFIIPTYDTTNQQLHNATFKCSAIIVVL